MSRSTNTLIINKLALAASVDASPGLALQPNPGTSEYIELSATTSRWVGELEQTPIEPSEFPIGPTTITQIDDLSEVTEPHTGPVAEVRQEPSLQVTNLAKVGNLIISTPAPVDPIGEFGDVVGMIRAGDDGIYYCSADFNGVDEIWKFAGYTTPQHEAVTYEVPTSNMSIAPLWHKGYLRFTYSGEKYATLTAEGATGDWVQFSAGQEFHISNRASEGNLTIDAQYPIILNPPKGGSLILEPGDTVTVKFVSDQEADVMGSTLAAPPTPQV